MVTDKLDNLCVNSIRFLAADAVQAANSGHPGMPLGAAPMAYTLWSRYLKFNPSDPGWFDRDRFVLSAGHGSALLYAMLHLFGYDLPLAEIKNFRQWGSKTPGHPEYGMTPGVEATTGPLGQGIANAVGMAIAETHLAARYNRPNFDIVDHYTYAICGDGDLMEGISYEACSLAGHLKLEKLILLYDSNDISIEGSTGLAFTENVRKRFEAFGWGTHFVADGNDLEAISSAIQNARNETGKPSLIEIKTEIGYGAPNKQGKASAHGEPLGEEELDLTRENLGWPHERFHLPKEAMERFARFKNRGEQTRKRWQEMSDKYSRKYPEYAGELTRLIDGKLPLDIQKALPRFNTDDGPIATRAVSGKCLNTAAGLIPELFGGSADLAPSNKTIINDSENYSAENRTARNFRFGVREHAMGAIMNGLSLHGGIRPYGGTFLIFSDYMKPAIRLAALSRLPIIYVFTHDSLGVGEDGPTHQPVEQLAGLRAIPNLTVIRPADANETVLAWEYALARKNGPTALILTRQKLPVIDPEEYPAVSDGLTRGAYCLSDSQPGEKPDLILAATGSEVSLALEVQKVLKEQGINSSVHSCPSWEVYGEQSESYRKEQFPEVTPVVSLEAGVTVGWRKYFEDTGSAVGVDKFGASAPGGLVLDKYGFNVDNIVVIIQAILNKKVRSRE